MELMMEICRKQVGSEFRERHTHTRTFCLYRLQVQMNGPMSLVRPHNFDFKEILTL